MFFGFYFVAIFNIFIDSIKLMNNEEFIKLSKCHLRNYHKKHLQIMQKLKDFDNIFSFVKTTQTGSCLPLIAGAFYQIMLYPNIAVTYVMLFAIIAQLFEICLLGEYFHCKIEEIFRTLYLTKWYEMSQEDKMILLMMMKMTTNSFSLKAAGMYEINMMAFVGVIKFCFSFCVILLAFV